MNDTTPVQRKTLTVDDLPVGTEVQMARRVSYEQGSEVRDAKVTKVTKTTLTLDNGLVFNVSCNARFTQNGVITGERQTRNSYIRRGEGWVLYLPGDPYLAATLEGERIRKEREEARKEFVRTMNAVASRQNHETVQAALDALNTWLTNNPKES